MITDLKEDVYGEAELRSQQKIQEDKYLETVRLKSGIVKDSSIVTNPANKCAKNCLQQHSLEKQFFEWEKLQEKKIACI